MKLLVFCALILCFETVFVQAVSIEPHYTSPLNQVVVYAFKKPLVLSCNVSDVPAEEANSVSVSWRKNGELVPSISSLKNRWKMTDKDNVFNLTISETDYNDVGNWTCEALIVGLPKVSADILVVTRIASKIKTEYINVVEEEKLRIECSVLGNPYPSLSWRIEAGNFNGSASDDDKYQIQNYTDDSGKLVENGVLFIEKVNKSDRGTYYCTATNRFWSENHDESHAIIRVKDKYAALWPFLGICIEVIVLCAVIIIYEKKRNKTELEESDTDQSPDQKNTPDHGKEANLRHRQ